MCVWRSKCKPNLPTQTHNCTYVQIEGLKAKVMEVGEMLTRVRRSENGLFVVLSLRPESGHSLSFALFPFLVLQLVCLFAFDLSLFVSLHLTISLFSEVVSSNFLRYFSFKLLTQTLSPFIYRSVGCCIHSWITGGSARLPHEL